MSTLGHLMENASLLSPTQWIDSDKSKDATKRRMGDSNPRELALNALSKRAP